MATYNQRCPCCHQWEATRLSDGNLYCRNCDYGVDHADALHEES